MPFLRIRCTGQRPEDARRFDLATNQVSIGRGPQNQLVIEEDGISRSHALLVRGRKGWLISDAGSQNGVFVDGKRVERAVLAHGATIKIGAAEIEFNDLQAGETHAMSGTEVAAEAKKVGAASYVLLSILLLGLVAGVAYVMQLWVTKKAPVGRTEQKPATIGTSWHGSLQGGLDFRLTNPVDQDGMTVFQYEAWRRDGSGKERGKMGVLLHNRKLQLMQVDDANKQIRVYNGLFEPNGRLVTGVAYAMPDGLPSQGGTPFWATVDASAPVPGVAVDLNQANVSALEPAVGRDAWRVVERRLIEGPYTGVADLDALGLPDAALVALKQVVHVE